MRSDQRARLAKEATLSAVVTRCGCGDPDSHRGRVCPTPAATEDLGIVSYWHVNPLRRVAWRISRRLHGNNVSTR